MQQITEPYDRKPKPKEALTNIGASIWPRWLRRSRHSPYILWYAAATRVTAASDYLPASIL